MADDEKKVTICNQNLFGLNNIPTAKSAYMFRKISNKNAVSHKNEIQRYCKDFWILYLSERSFRQS